MTRILQGGNNAEILLDVDGEKIEMGRTTSLYVGGMLKFATIVMMKFSSVVMPH